MSLDKTIRENLAGKYLIIHANYFSEGMEYADQIKIPQIQLRGIIGIENIDFRIDFSELEKLSDSLRYLSIAGVLENIDNFESIYLLKNLEEINFQDTQKFTIDISKFPKIKHLGCDYWKGLINIGNAHSLKSIVMRKLTDTIFKQFSELEKLEILHIYYSKITTLKSIEGLPIEYLCVAHNRSLENIQAIKTLKKIKRIKIEKCKKIVDYNFLEELKNKINLKIIW